MLRMFLSMVLVQHRKLIKGTPDLVKTVIVQRETDAVIKEILSDTTDIENFARTLDRFAEESLVFERAYTVTPLTLRPAAEDRSRPRPPAARPARTRVPTTR